MLPDYEVMETDVLVIGSGAAGCLAAIAAVEKGARVTLVTKGPFPCGVTSMAIGSFAVALGHSDPADNPSEHARDALAAGMGLNDPDVVAAWTKAALEATPRLLEWGLPLVKVGDKIHQKPNIGHRYPRAVHCEDHIGKALLDCVAAQVTRRPIQMLQHMLVTDLLVAEGIVRGAYGLDYRSGKTFVVQAAATVLATGGAGHVYSYSDNPKIIKGDGYAMAWRAGAELVDMEMIDFMLVMCHPERLWMYPPHVNATLRRKGGRFYNGLGERFMKRYCPEHAERVPERAAVCRVAALEIYEGRATKHGGVYLDGSEALDEISQAPPRWYRTIQEAGIDMSYQPLELVPAAHTFLGGIRIDATGKTSLEGLYAAGETAGGVHGANRLGGAALSDAIAFGFVAGEAAAAKAGWESGKRTGSGELDSMVREAATRLEGFQGGESGIEPSQLTRAVQETMTANAMVIREERSLSRAQETLDRLRVEVAPKLRVSAGSGREMLSQLREVVEAVNLLQVAMLVTRAADMRRETRGAHYRLDYPLRDDEHWLRNIVLTRAGEEVSAEVRTARGGTVAAEVH